LLSLHLSQTKHLHHLDLSEELSSYASTDIVVSGEVSLKRTSSSSFGAFLGTTEVIPDYTPVWLFDERLKAVSLKPSGKGLQNKFPI